MMACQGLPASSFVAGVLDYIDCQAQTIGAGGYQALAAPGSTLSLMLAGLLTLFVAFFGYRMLFGESLSVRDGVLAMIKIGIVLALATGWPAYRTLIYDVALKGPAELAGEIGAPSALPGAGGGLVARLEQADQALLAFAIQGTGEGSAAPQAANPQQPQQPVLQQDQRVPLLSFNELMLGGARVLFLASAIGALAVVRLVAGLLLALGPFFIAFLLFDGTRGLFEGWLRVLGGAALGALGTAIVLGVELALLEPWLAWLLTYRYAGYQTPGAAMELFALSLVFAVTLAAMLYTVARVAYGFRLPVSWRSVPAQLAEALRGGESLRVPVTAQERSPANADRPRAVTVADAVAATQRRESPMPVAALAAAGAPGRTVIRPGSGRDEPPPPPTPLGQSHRRRTRTRQSGSASRRDKGA